MVHIPHIPAMDMEKICSAAIVEQISLKLISDGTIGKHSFSFKVLEGLGREEEGGGGRGREGLFDLISAWGF